MCLLHLLSVSSCIVLTVKWLWSYNNERLNTAIISIPQKNILQVTF